MHRKLIVVVACVTCSQFLAGCGTTKSQLATEQLLASDAVDRSVANIDFSPLRDKKVFLDADRIKAVKGSGFVNADYIIGSLRQQIVAANCLLQENRDDAEYIVEARVGALGTDSHDVTYGIPASQGLSNAARLLPNAPVIPTIPEISLAKKTDELGVAKIAVFAYHRESREFYWQSGLSQARSSAKNTWLMGAGPFQSGTINDHTRFAGEELNLPHLKSEDKNPTLDPYSMYSSELKAAQPRPVAPETESPQVQTAHYTENADQSAESKTVAPDSKPAAPTQPAAPPTEKTEQQSK